MSQNGLHVLVENNPYEQANKMHSTINIYRETFQDIVTIKQASLMAYNFVLLLHTYTC